MVRQGLVPEAIFRVPSPAALLILDASEVTTSMRKATRRETAYHHRSANVNVQECGSLEYLTSLAGSNYVVPGVRDLGR